MKFKLSISIFLLFTCFFIQAQELSSKATVSVITGGSGNEMHSAFGHSAFRVFDPISNIDKMYNYGTFDFDTPNFYSNFLKGELTYHLSTVKFPLFVKYYKKENRWLKAQVLNLNQSQVQKIYNFLENNAKPENKYYQYSFLYDNCSTKIEEIIKTTLKEKVLFSNNHITTNKTHRDLLSESKNKFKWGILGINIVLGSKIDVNIAKDEYKFLPNYLFSAFENATIIVDGVNKPLVIKEVSFIEEEPKKKSFDFFSPFIVFLIISILITYTTYKNYRNQKRSRCLDFLIYFSTGIMGAIVLFLWFASGHIEMKNNFNFLWAFAPNLVASFFIIKKNIPNWLLFYNRILVLLIIILFVFWVSRIQIFNISLLPLFIALAFRYYYLSTRKLF